MGRGIAQLRREAPAPEWHGVGRVCLHLAENKREPQRPDARMQLNEWRQTKHLAAFGYDLVDHQGPSHQPIFVMTGWAELPDGARCTTEPVTAGSKKEAQMAAADALRAMLEANANFTGLWTSPSSA